MVDLINHKLRKQCLLSAEPFTAVLLMRQVGGTIDGIEMIDLSLSRSIGSVVLGFRNKIIPSISCQSIGLTHFSLLSK